MTCTLFNRCRSMHGRHYAVFRKSVRHAALRGGGEGRQGGRKMSLSRFVQNQQPARQRKWKNPNASQQGYRHTQRRNGPTAAVRARVVVVGVVVVVLVQVRTARMAQVHPVTVVGRLVVMQARVRVVVVVVIVTVVVTVVAHP